MPEDNTPITPTMPPVDTTQDYSAVSSNTPDDYIANDVSASNPAAQAAPVVAPPAEYEINNSPIVEPDNTVLPEAEPDGAVVEQGKDIYAELTSKIRASKNILIALSSNPSVDEMSAAIGLSLYLDKLGKRATAIYSGVTPNALEFLKPEETFESTADALQDFVIALNKEKADHLRYKLDGEFVKIYITPYRTRISDSDLEFSYGDFNVDLVLALDVANGIDLDSALREHGRIMHDAVIVNISTSKPGKFGEIEWSDKASSSVSEMIAKLLYAVEGDVKIGKEEATAFLTGIVAATNRFSNASTTPETMQTASKLMESGANQQLVSKNITPDVENEVMTLYPEKNNVDNQDDPTKLDIDHDGDRNLAEEGKEVDADIANKESTLLDDLKIAEENLAQAGAEAINESTNEPTMKINTDGEDANLAEPVLQDNPDLVSSDGLQNTIEETPKEKIESEEAYTNPTDFVEQPTIEAEEPIAPENIETEYANIPNNSTAVTPEIQPTSIESKRDFLDNPTVEPEMESMEASDEDGMKGYQDEKVIQPEAGFDPDAQDEFTSDKYGHMLEDALNNVGESNPAAVGAPSVPSAPEINGVPEMNYNATTNDNILPPPPAPPVDMGGMPFVQGDNSGQESVALPEVKPIEVAAPPAEPTLTSLGSQPAMQDQVYNSQAADPGAFKIPGA